MRGESQAIRLEEIMQEHLSRQVYDLSLLPVYIKPNTLKKLKSGMIVMLRMAHPKLVLCRDGDVYASVKMDQCKRSVIITDTDIGDKYGKTDKQRKDEKLFCFFGSLAIKETKKDTVIDITSFDMQRVTLMIAGMHVAHGRLVWVNSKIAVQIDRVEK